MPKKHIVRNPLLGEVDVFGTHVILTAGAWIAIETRLNKSVLQILHDASEMEIGYREIQVILEEGANAWLKRNGGKPDFTAVDALAMIEEHGLNLLDPLGDAIQGSPALGIHVKKDAPEGEDAAPLV